MTQKLCTNANNGVSVSDRLDMSLDDVIALTTKTRTRYTRPDFRRSRLKNPRDPRSQNRWLTRTRQPQNIEAMNHDDMSEGEIPAQQISRRRFMNLDKFPAFPRTRLRNYAAAEGRHVRVAGLDYSIMTSDLEELFLSVGPIERCWVDFDKTDRSLGTGGVIFVSPRDARRAIQMFNGRLIDEQPLQLDLVQRAFPRRN